MGLNLEEARDFSDNSKEFVESANKFLQYSTQKQVKLTAPCANMTKIDIINYAIDNNLDLNIIKSCYDNIKNTSRKNCGKCMSCKLLYNAIINSNKPELVKELF
jgi:7-cyano-7-deazaguanine synthase